MLQSPILGAYTYFMATTSDYNNILHNIKSLENFWMVYVLLNYIESR